ncbi:MAG TPA: YjbF family lipoprotein [Rhizomicrobium sp.]|nr:YjbF family lipoprotein [Rhizomicrobium sp.]
MAKSASISMTSPIPGNLARAGALSAALGLAACSSGNGGGDWNQIFDLVQSSWNGKSDSITLDQAGAIPYASLGIRAGDGAQVLVVLGANQNGRMLWTSAAKIAIETENGRVVRTAGFPGDSSNVDLVAADPLVAFEQGHNEEQHASRTVDFKDIGQFGVILNCTLSSEGTETVDILGSNIATRKVSEHCHSEQLDWTFDNTFWIGESGLVWKSIQYIHPKADPLTIEVLRPAG